MRITRILLLICLTCSISAQAQFGKLGDLAKKAQKKPDTSVQRGRSGSPEVVSASADMNTITGGETKTLTFTIKNADAKSFTSSKTPDCLEVSNIKAISETQVSMTVRANNTASDGNCAIILENDKNQQISQQVKVKHMPQPGENFKPEQVSLEQAFAPQWIIKLPGGGTETLTRGKQTPQGGYEYKDTKGKWYTTMAMGMMVMFNGSYGNQCSYQAMMNTKKEGLFMPMSNACGYAIGQRLEADSK